MGRVIQFFEKRFMRNWDSDNMEKELETFPSKMKLRDESGETAKQYAHTLVMIRPYR
jgi:hypothetical protein